jgi:hypothetical protein
MPKYNKDVLHSTKRSADSAARKYNKAGADVVVKKVTLYKVVPRKRSGG